MPSKKTGKIKGKKKGQKRVEREKRREVREVREVRGLEESQDSQEGKKKKKWGWLALGGVGTAGLLGALYLSRRKNKNKNKKINPEGIPVQEIVDDPKTRKENDCAVSALNLSKTLDSFIVRFYECVTDWQGEGMIAPYDRPNLPVIQKESCPWTTGGKKACDAEGVKGCVFPLIGDQAGLVVKQQDEIEPFAKEVMAYRAIFHAFPPIGPGVDEISYCPFVQTFLPFHILMEKLEETAFDVIMKQSKPLDGPGFVVPFLKVLWRLRKSLRHRDYLKLDWSPLTLMRKGPSRPGREVEEEDWRLIGFQSALPWFMDEWRDDYQGSAYEGNYIHDLDKFLNELVKPLLLNPTRNDEKNKNFWQEWAQAYGAQNLLMVLHHGLSSSIVVVEQATAGLNPFDEIPWTRKELEVLRDSLAAGGSKRSLALERVKDLLTLKFPSGEKEEQKEKKKVEQPSRALLVETIDEIEDKLLAWALSKISSSSSSSSSS